MSPSAHLLGATRFGGEGECCVAQLVWRYADGSARTSDILIPKTMSATGFVSRTRLPRVLPYAFSKVVWRAPVPGQDGRWVRLYRFSYANPEPGRVIQQIEFVSAMQNPNLFVAGLTLDPGAAGRTAGRLAKSRTDRSRAGGRD